MASSSSLWARNFSNIFRFLRPGGNRHNYSSPNAPLFQRRPPFWVTWTWAIVAGDAFMTGSVMDLTWNHWSQPISQAAPSSASPTQPRNPDHEPHVLRPTWQRLGLCLGFFAGGVVAAGALLIAGFRFVKVLDVIRPALSTPAAKPPQSSKAHLKGLPSSKSPTTATISEFAETEPLLFVQSANNLRTRGLAFPLSKCTIRPGRPSAPSPSSPSATTKLTALSPSPKDVSSITEMILTVEGEQGHWHLALDGGLDSIKNPSKYPRKRSMLINGEPVDSRSAVTTILQAWKGGWIDGDFGDFGYKPAELEQPVQGKKKNRKKKDDLEKPQSQVGMPLEKREVKQVV